jgi:hypothetical protein
LRQLAHALVGLGHGWGGKALRREQGRPQGRLELDLGLDMPRGLWQGGEKLQPRGHVADGFLMGGLHESLLPRLCMIGDGPLRVLPAGKVHRQHRGNLRRTVAIPRLQPHPNAPMSLHPPLP